jgi:CRP-like cAMP-binding protein
MKQGKYNAGDVIFKEGDPSDVVYKVVSGEIEVFMESEGKTVVLGLMKAGEFLGEMGIVDDQPRSASARAKNQVAVITYKENEFLRLISRDSLSAERLIIRLCERLRNVSRKFTEATVSTKKKGTIETAVVVGGTEVPEAGPISKTSGSTGYRLTLLPLSQQLMPHLLKEGIEVTKLPFTVGRLPEGNEPESATQIDLKIPDKSPFRLSRRHFALYENPDGYGVLDLGSALGTELNEDFLGHNFGKDFGYLKPGENKITAGGIDSPFHFKILMEPVE